jgi:hypothetical protein
MKKILFLTLLAFTLSNCEVKVRSAKAYSNGSITSHDENINGMTYRVWTLEGSGWTSQTGYVVYVVNISKDKIEYENALLQHELLLKQVNKK